MDGLQAEGSVAVFIQEVKAYLKAEQMMKLCKVYRDFFSEMKKNTDETIEDFIDRFEKGSHLFKK